MDSRTAARLRSGVTLVALLALVVGAAIWGWQSLTEPLPTASDEGCVPTDVAAGDKVYADQVLVSVLNAGTRSGLAERTMGELTDAGFVEGSSSNAPQEAEVQQAQIWTDDPQSPAVRLVRTALGRGVTDVVRRDPVADGVNVVVGDDFEGAGKGRKAVRVREDTSICSPPT